MQILFDYFLGRPFSMNASPSNLMSFWTTNFHFAFLLAIVFDRYKPAQSQCLPKNKNMFKISIITLELALAAVNYFR